jgi:hypothetical protein
MSLPLEIESQNRIELIRAANEMLEGRMHLIVGVRKICGLRHQIGDADNPVFMPIRAIDSETDHLPIGQMRDGCDAGYLQRVDAEMKSYLDQAKEDILAACREIVRAFE